MAFANSENSQLEIINLLDDFLQEILAIDSELSYSLGKELYFNLEEENIADLVGEAMDEWQELTPTISELIEEKDGKLTLGNLIDEEIIGEYLSLRKILGQLDKLIEYDNRIGTIRHPSQTPEEDNNAIFNDSPYNDEVILAHGDAGGLVDTRFFGDFTNDIDISRHRYIEPNRVKYNPILVKTGESSYSDPFNDILNVTGATVDVKTDVSIEVRGSANNYNGHRYDLLVDYVRGFGFDNRTAPYREDKLLNGGENLTFRLTSRFQGTGNNIHQLGTSSYWSSDVYAQSVSVRFWNFQAGENADITLRGDNYNQSFTISASDLDSQGAFSVGVNSFSSIDTISISPNSVNDDFGVKEVGFGGVNVTAYLTPPSSIV